MHSHSSLGGSPKDSVVGVLRKTLVQNGYSVLSINCKGIDQIQNISSSKTIKQEDCDSLEEAASSLDWLEKKNRVKPREKEDLRDDLVEKNQILIEDDFDFENGEETLENFFGQPNSNLSDFI